MTTESTSFQTSTSITIFMFIHYQSIIVQWMLLQDYFKICSNLVLNLAVVQSDGANNNNINNNNNSNKINVFVADMILAKSIMSYIKVQGLWSLCGSNQ